MSKRSLDETLHPGGFITTSLTLAIFFVFYPGIALALDAKTEIDILSRLWPYHATPMILGFILLFSGAIVARRKSVGWFNKHKALVLTGATFAMIGVAMAAYMVRLVSEGHFRVPHAYLGALVIFLLILTPTLGFAQFRMVKRREVIRNLHRWSGRLTLFLMALNISFGLLLATML